MYESLKCWSFGTFFFEVIQLLIRHFHHARNIPRKNSSKHTYKDPLLAWEFSTMAECNSFDSQISYQIIFKWNIRQSQYRIGSLKIIQFSSNVKYVSAIQFLPARTMFCCVYNLRRPQGPQFCSRAEKKSISKKNKCLKTFLEIETTHYLEGLDLKLNNKTFRWGSSLLLLLNTIQL